MKIQTTNQKLFALIIKTSSNRNKHLRYRDLTFFNTHYFELIQLDNTFEVEHSET